jgi:glycosyltransferase involved in cell wall biosynthesis
MVNIWTHIAWDNTGQKNLGKAYNACLDQHQDNDWVAFLDHDAVFTTDDWYLQLQEIIKNNPNCKGICSRVNRMATLEQMVVGIDPFNFDYSYHRNVGKFLANKYKNESKQIKNKGHMSGVFFAVHVGTIKKLGGCANTGQQLSVDNLTQAKIIDAGYEFRIANGIYVFHWYRADAPYKHSKHILQQLEKAHYNSLRLT